MENPRAAVPAMMLDAIRERHCSGVEVLPIVQGLDLQTIDFLVAGGIGPSWSEVIKPALPTLTRLQVVQSMSAGTDWIEQLVPPQATLCNARGTRDRPVAEWILGALLGYSSRLLESACRTSWAERAYVRDLSTATVVVVGMGSIGRMLEAMLKPIGTRGLIAAPELALLHDGALVVNAARGLVLDTDALVAETGSGRLFAVLDVTEPEPLPDGHPLWSAAGVLSITPHIAGGSELADRNVIELAADQLGRWLGGEPLLNVVSRAPRSG